MNANISSNTLMKPDNNQTIYEFFIFNRSGVCVVHLDLLEDQLGVTNKALNLNIDRKNENRYKLIFGLLFSMKSFTKNISPNKNFDFFKSFITSNYKLHFVEFLNGLRFVIISGPIKHDLSCYLKDIYSAFYVNFISKNVLVNKDEPIKNEIFLELVTNFLNSINSSIS
jgi:hypothetical protein